MSFKDFFKDADFFSCCAKLEDCPRSDGEIVFIGRSNVGKSTLINSIVEKKLAFASKMPGRTTTVNFFSIDKGKRKFIVDLPGYGFSKANKEAREMWKTLMLDYLTKREAIKMIFLLIDSRIGCLEVDYDLITFLDQHKINVSIVLTKIDKLNNQELNTLAETWCNEFDVKNIIKQCYFASNKEKTVVNLLIKDLAKMLS